MTELTKEYFDKALRSLATQKGLNRTNETLERTNQTISRSTALLANLVEDFHDFRADMKNIPAVLDSHTTTLDAIFKSTEHWKTEAEALRSAIKRHERWITEIAKRLDLNLRA